MPTPERTSRGEIVAAGRDILELEGPSGFTMQAVADAVGVRAPSLYKRVRDRDALLDLVVAATMDDLAVRLEASDRTITGLARAYREFAHRRPEGFRLVLSFRADPEALARLSAPVLAATEQVVGSDEALDAARLVTAWVVGFISMELAGAFRLGGDLDQAFEFALVRLRTALTTPTDRVVRSPAT